MTESNSTETEVLDPKQRRGARILWRVVLTAIVLSLVAAALVMRTWTLFWIALLLGIPYSLLLMAPFWLARLSGGKEQTAQERE